MTTDAETRLAALEKGTDLATALAYYDALPAVTVAQILGNWKGNGIATDNPFDGLLEQFGWHGKRFDSADEAYPLVFDKGSGDTISIDPSRIPISIALEHGELARSSAAAGLFKLGAGLIASSRPHARLRMTEYRGIVSATMIYDALPINDVFRAAGPDTLVGAMDMRGLANPFFFVLRRESGAATGDRS